MTKSQLQLDFVLIPPWSFRYQRQSSQTTLEMFGCLDISQARHSVLAGLEPLRDGTLAGSGSGQRVCQPFRLTLDYIRKVMLEHRRGAGMQFLPPGPQQCAIGGVLYQRMLEPVRRLWRHAAAEQ